MIELALLQARENEGPHSVYLRFIVLAPRRRRGLGLFRADTWLLDDPTLPEWLRRPIDEHFAWFNEHLPMPRNASRRTRLPPAAICWFRPQAHDHIARARELAWLIDEAGHPTAMVKTRRVGDVIYRDDFQVVAKPEASTRLSV